jgi:hypothetical protein
MKKIDFDRFVKKNCEMFYDADRKRWELKNYEAIDLENEPLQELTVKIKNRFYLFKIPKLPDRNIYGWSYKETNIFLDKYLDDKSGKEVCDEIYSLTKKEVFFRKLKT